MFLLVFTSCDPTDTSIAKTVVPGREDTQSIIIDVPDRLKGKELWYELKNQHGATDYSGAFKVPKDRATLKLLLNGHDRSITALTDSLSVRESHRRKIKPGSRYIK